MSQQQSQQQSVKSHASGSRSRKGNGATDPPIAIENVELLEADQQRRYFPQPPQQQGGGGGFMYGGPPPPGSGGMPPIYGMPPPPPPPPPSAYYGSTGPPVYPGVPPPPSSSSSNMAYAQRRTRSTPLPNAANYKEAEATMAAYPSEYQPLMQHPQQPPPHHVSVGSSGGGGGFPYGNLASVAAAAMHMESTSSTGALTLDDIEKSFNTMVNQQFHHNPHHRAFASTSDIPPPPAPLVGGAPTPRRSNNTNPSHRRTGSLGNALPPPSPVAGRSPTGSRTNRKRADSASSGQHHRARSFSGTPLHAAAAGGVAAGSTFMIPTGVSMSASGSVSGRGHRRTLSRASSTADASVASIASMLSVVSDISKSAFFGGVTETGQVQMHYPTEHVRIIMQTSLPRGHVFCHPIEPTVYEAYHLAAEEVQQLQWENVEDDEDDLFPSHASRSSNPLNPYKSLACHCKCNNCAGCTGKTQLLPKHHFVINVPDDIYRRLLDEVIDSQDMPCNLYFCGHHEDVSTPSIWIAATIVGSLFLFMGGVAFVTGG